MSTAQTTANKATYRRLRDAVNSGDAELISKTIDEVVEPDLVIRRTTSLPSPVGRRHLLVEPSLARPLSELTDDIATSAVAQALSDPAESEGD